ncbi:helix-turn-helix domain-containing protein [Thiomicrospira cyclica]|uniref:Helix-turn-helix domain protein n=1 Tax=Thiomicrospira cyclica (strain DSM 14477 / JCM 11371 / ALM1) TaxID=717773 RepID=F6D9T3_THICA|nr:helix-turn-helix domain-containing protein [Thiomicrospira cyclica]AEG32132.1 helix-turn-helix domain protein [Thiomicrospira cyclica ALM1]
MHDHLYHYTECGLDNVYLANGYEVVIEDGETYTSIHALDDLHAQIGHALTQKTSALTAQEFRFLRTELNLSQKALGDLLGVDGQTVARWEKGETTIPRTSDVILRAYYQETLQQDSHIALLLKSLSELDTNDTMNQLEFEKRDKHWVRKTA